MKYKSTLLLLCGFLFASFSNAQQKVIQLYNGAAPGSENWNWNEAVNDSNIWQTKVVYNVSHPTLTVFLPDASIATGTAVIVCPGGGFHALSIDSEGEHVARWLNKKGVVAFVLKYRLAHSLTDNPVNEMMAKWGKKEFDDENRAVIPMGIADAREAINYVRKHAGEYGIMTNHIGIVGFSAGGTMAASTAYGYNKENRPDFVAPIYAFMPPELQKDIPSDAPPMFLLAATDDNLGLAPHSGDLYAKWVASKHEAELHLYAKGGHGFGMRTQHLNSDTWIDRFGDWLKQQGYLKLLNPPEWTKQYTDAQLEEFKREAEERFHNDWANLARYHDANAKLSTGVSTKPRVVFMGNSITDGWIDADSSFFAGKNYIDRGISGQTTPQMVLRFRPDVIDLKPKVVLILAGINDIAGNTGPMSLEQTFGNIVSMVQLAKASNIKVVISSVLPAFDFPWHPGLQPAEKVMKLNEMLKGYAQKNNIVYLDYFTAMKDGRNGLPDSLSSDGVHPNLAGYKIMEPLAEMAIAEALKRK